MSTSLIEQFLYSWEWEANFKPEDWCKPRVGMPDKDPCELASEMIQEGSPLWSHPGWIKSVHRAFLRMIRGGSLVKVTLLAKWLLENKPEFVVDDEFVPYLEAVAEGRFYDVVPRLYSSWPYRSEYYRKNLNLRLTMQAMDNELGMRADARMALLRKTNPRLFAS